ncbi:hypothetical protein SYNTR_1653 [Candidatus Syntrophocurvum alkaliphilum]|uniref:Precorrin-6A reductase n=1 Tax=Candidatus Syntrophocurvum alkaliphilum TaxID=2293317 RepID=A0A6I6DGM8_9FIRM|nr:precorrin-6A reductase [Candidatus Syntrophocurvum alkaliphilum]QGU00247.1 hypothetical protein SYNTR_1653 [Candidatus Syntrophocurvum alkaliphilum]
MILVLAGTTEGREILLEIKARGWPYIASLYSDYGAKILSEVHEDRLINGPLGKKGLSELVIEKQIKVIVDTTHPFATEISQNAINTAKQLKLPYIRLERKQFDIKESSLVKKIHSLEEIKPYLLNELTVFSTLGSNSLPALIPIIKSKNAKLFIRVIPNSQILKQCEKLGLNKNQIIAKQGPFSIEDNMKMFKHVNANLILSKESGVEGGLDTKIAAAKALKTPHLILARPNINYPIAYNSYEDVIKYLSNIY